VNQASLPRFSVLGLSGVTIRRVPPADSLAYIGTYTGRGSGGIHAAVLSGGTGKLTSLGLAAEAVHPSFLALHPNGRFLYAVSEQPDGLMSAWAFDPKSGALQFLNQASSGGAGPCHIAVERSGRLAIVANYAGGGIAALQLLPDGRLGCMTARDQWTGGGPRLSRQSGPHPHGAFFSPDQRFAVVPDLGCDQLRLYRLNPAVPGFVLTGLVRTEAGAGPRHFVFHPSGSCGHALCELDSTVVTYRYDHVNGALTPSGSVSLLPPQFSGVNIAAEIATDASGRYLYCSNRGADTITVFRIAPDGSLDLVQHAASIGRSPRHFAIDASGNWMMVANQDSDLVSVFHRDFQSGELTPAGQEIEVASPACVVLAPMAGIQEPETGLHRN
jgi:6-phosphogluconolactonase